MNIGTDHDTAAFAVASIRARWRGEGRRLYPWARSLLITADGGGSNGYRLRLWKLELQAFADEADEADLTCRRHALRNYLTGFSPNTREALEMFDFDGTIPKVDDAAILFLVLERLNVDLHPAETDNHTMGTVFEELIRKFNEAMNENPGGHFTPGDVVHWPSKAADCIDMDVA